MMPMSPRVEAIFFGNAVENCIRDVTIACAASASSSQGKRAREHPNGGYEDKFGCSSHREIYARTIAARALSVLSSKRASLPAPR